MSKLEEVYEFDIRIRLYDDRAAPNGVLLVVHGANERNYVAPPNH
jgi:hypothetical protein